MALNIKNAETEKLVRELARRRGQGITEAFTDVVRREDGSLLLDGALAMEEVRELLGLEERRADSREYRSLGGWIFTELGRVPAEGDHFEAEGHRIEVVDMDGNRIDKVLVQRLARGEDPPG